MSLLLFNDGKEGEMELFNNGRFLFLFSLSIDFNRANYDREILFKLNDFFISFIEGYFFFFYTVALL